MPLIFMTVADSGGCNLFEMCYLTHGIIKTLVARDTNENDNLIFEKAGILHGRNGYKRVEGFLLSASFSSKVYRMYLLS